MSIAPEQVEAPARDAVLFRSSPARTFIMVFAALMVAYLAVSPIVGWIAGDSGDPWWVTALQAVVIGATVAGAYALSARAALPTWVRVSAGGLELAAQDSDPILLAWPDVAAVVIRRDGLRTVLEVVPADLDSVHPVQDADHGEPLLVDTARGPAFTADLTQIWPSPRALRRELDRRMRAAGKA
ncbi:hypothetical protein [Actinoplanes aureus]|jgi:hypothetical protein|uniref:PH domain-containing protein n=1 Tax=Actinoplanes aureus TaxID=2792083 RepID=A0A931CB67_9ACTN|nr:hypothetical protein [Actinoplanes aureus]MBG0561670.1 hypothetical protein [Actinoplanes aureus]